MKYNTLKRVFTNTQGKTSYSVLCLETDAYYRVSDKVLLDKLVKRKKVILVNVAKKSDV